MKIEIPAHYWKMLFYSKYWYFIIYFCFSIHVYNVSNGNYITPILIEYFDVVNCNSFLNTNIPFRSSCPKFCLEVLVHKYLYIDARERGICNAHCSNVFNSRLLHISFAHFFGMQRRIGIILFAAFAHYITMKRRISNTFYSLLWV